MFGKGVKLFSLFGFEVRLDASWLILGVLITWSLADGFFPHFHPGYSPQSYWLAGVVGALGLLFSILFHEFSHSLVARRYGLPIGGITLFIFGGVAQMREEPPSARAEFVMAAAGPVSSLLLAELFYLVHGAAKAAAMPELAVGVLLYFSILNIALALFNLVPAFPLDGGRMLRAVLWGWRRDLHWATRVASGLGRGFGMALVLIGVYAFIQGDVIGGMWWALIGLFLRGAAAASYRQLLSHEALRGETVSRFMNSHPVVVAHDIPVDSLVEDYFYRYHLKWFPVVDGERLVGCIGSEVLRRLPRHEWPDHRVDDLMERCGEENTVAPQSDALEALARMHRTGRSRLMVVGGDGRLVGILALRDLLSFLALKLDLEQ